jgi:hypothetical protein
VLRHRPDDGARLSISARFEAMQGFPVGAFSLREALSPSPENPLISVLRRSQAEDMPMDQPQKLETLAELRRRYRSHRFAACMSCCSSAATSSIG